MPFLPCSPQPVASLLDCKLTIIQVFASCFESEAHRPHILLWGVLSSRCMQILHGITRIHAVHRHSMLHVTVIIFICRVIEAALCDGTYSTHLSQASGKGKRHTPMHANSQDLRSLACLHNGFVKRSVCRLTCTSEVLPYLRASHTVLLGEAERKSWSGISDRSGRLLPPSPLSQEHTCFQPIDASPQVGHRLFILRSN